eukprot:287544-Prorocentrum_minimum.AAC.6
MQRRNQASPPSVPPLYPLCTSSPGRSDEGRGAEAAAADAVYTILHHARVPGPDVEAGAGGAKGDAREVRLHRGGNLKHLKNPKHTHTHTTMLERVSLAALRINRLRIVGVPSVRPGRPTYSFPARACDIIGYFLGPRGRLSRLSLLLESYATSTCLLMFCESTRLKKYSPTATTTPCSQPKLEVWNQAFYLAAITFYPCAIDCHS